MDLIEKTLLVSSLLLIFGSVALRLTHIIDYAYGQSVLSIGFVLGMIAHRRYARRLWRRNEELEQLLARALRQPE
ncbi:MAG TPA: hypothetical protein VK364_13680 [Hymenobacter sp.]|nr:hypothetical protein [Hymenobacter sp.]